MPAAATANPPANPAAPQRRTLSFASLDDLAAEARRIADADRAGTLRRAGNWSAGRTFGHIATWIDFALDGYPPDLRPPWLIKVILRTQKKKFLRGPLPSGVRIPKIKEGTLGTQDLPTEEGLARVLRSCTRLASTAPTVNNPIFGQLTHQEWIAGNLRHAEHHLGFLHPA